MSVFPCMSLRHMYMSVSTCMSLGTHVTTRTSMTCVSLGTHIPAKRPCPRRLPWTKMTAQGTQATMATNINYSDTMPYTAPPRPTPPQVTPEEQARQDQARRETYCQHLQHQVDTFGSMYRVPSGEYNIRLAKNMFKHLRGLGVPRSVSL